jgi:hypothetical protein
VKPAHRSLTGPARLPERPSRPRAVWSSGAEVCAATLQDQESAPTQRRKAYEDAGAQRPKLDERNRQLAQRVERANALAAELRERRHDHALCVQLADDLRDDRFQAFLLPQTFRELVRGASERL